MYHSSMSLISKTSWQFFGNDYGRRAKYESAPVMTPERDVFYTKLSLRFHVPAEKKLPLCVLSQSSVTRQIMAVVE
jgi:hypothetical protein